MPSSRLDRRCRALPCTESYLRRCASVLASVRSLIATTSRSAFCSRAARTMQRPMRPNPLMPILMATRCSNPGRNRPDKRLILSGACCGRSNRPAILPHVRDVRALQPAERRRAARRLAVSPVPGRPPPQVRPQPAAAPRLSCRCRSTSTATTSIWIHAVSVGETLTTRALHRRAQGALPGPEAASLDDHDDRPRGGAQALRTSTASSTSRSTGASPSGGRCDVVRPRLFVMMETEIWPDAAARSAGSAGVATMLVNGRVSTALVRALPRWCAPFFRRVLADVDRFCMQSDEAARRIVALGADPARVTVTGSLKFDSLDWPGVGPHGQSRDRVLRFFRMRRRPGPVVIAASTLRGEDQAALDAFRRVQARWPRGAADHRAAPSRALRRGGAARRRGGLPRGPAHAARCAVDAVARRPTSSSSTPSASWRGSTRSPRVVFVGGSLVDAGGHNILEPAIFGKADRLRPAHAQLRGDCRPSSCAACAACRCTRRASSATCLVDLVGDPVQRARLGAAARAHRREQPRRQGPHARRRRGRCCRRGRRPTRGVVTPFRSVR